MLIHAKCPFDPQTHCSGRPFGFQSRTETPEPMSLRFLNLELIDQLRVDSFNDRSGRVDHFSDQRTYLFLLIGTRKRLQCDTMMFEQFFRQLFIDVGFVSQHRNARIGCQSFFGNRDIMHIRRSQNKIDHRTTAMLHFNFRVDGF